MPRSMQIGLILAAAVMLTLGESGAEETAVPVSYSHLGMCNDYEQNDSGEHLSAYSSAVKYSEGKANDIGVVVWTGSSLKPLLAIKVANKIVREINEQGLVARSFVASHRPEKSTAYAYVINGFAYPHDTSGLNTSEVIETMQAARGEATLLRANGLKGKDEHKFSTITVDKCHNSDPTVQLLSDLIEPGSRSKLDCCRLDNEAPSDGKRPLAAVRWVV